MTETTKGGDLFVVDNSDSGWTGLRYLSEWCDLSSSFDIATGFFEVGSLLALDSKWQQLEKIRILMGADVTLSTKRALLEATKSRVEQYLDEGLEGDKEPNPFLNGVPEIVDALRSGQIECRIYNQAKFHAKAYITHAKLEVVGAKALVGSSNFTRPGLSQNVELNIQVQSPGDVAQLQRWFDDHWEKGVDVREDVLGVIERHAKPYTPFDVYTRALHEFFEGHEITASEWEEGASQMFPLLDRYQKEAYWALMKIARQHGGAFLCDGVGLGKTFVGLMLIERLVVHERKRVVLFAPKGAKEGVWEPHLRDYLSHIGGMGGGADFSNLTVFSHTDLNRGGDFPERFRRVAELADAVVIDEAHHFRNPGRKGNEEDGTEHSRYYKLFGLLDPLVHPKSVYMLTATPINNQLTDLRHMIELFSRRDESYFARTLGVNNLTAHYNAMEKALRKLLGLDKIDLSDSLTEANELLANDETFQNLVVQRSRAYAVESQKLEKGSSAVFPDRASPKVAEYSVRRTYGKLLDMIEKAFEKNDPLFSLPVYYPLAYYKGSDAEVDPFEANRQKQVVSLIRTLFLKRFESSVRAFETSCYRLLMKLRAFLEIHSDSESEKKRLDRWVRQNEEILHYATDRQLSFWGEVDEEEEDEDIGIPEELLKKVPHLSRGEYDVEEIINETYLDLEQIVRFLAETQKFDPKHDDKLNKLKRLLKGKDLKDGKVLIFTEFADTARYLAVELKEDGIDGVTQVDSGSKGSRADVIKRFSPYYNASSSAQLGSKSQDEIRVLISTDILSEGLNLQDATRLINYDIHWNPVRLMQRIGRVDRRLNPDVEERLVADHPEVAASRGKVMFWNFLPPAELNEILSLYKTVTGKTLLISKTLGIEGKKLLTEKDDYEALREFNHAYEGTRTSLEDMHLEYQALLQEFPQLVENLKRMPGSIFSGRKKLAKGSKGVFFCYRLPALDSEEEEFTEEAGTARWYLYDLDRDEVLEEPGEIIESIKSKPSTPRRCVMEEPTLVEIRDKVLKHIKNGYLKRLDAPVGVKPTLKCWMELSEDS
ncbi:MAG: helicase-related protein [Actinomycetota bacterium]